MMRMMKVGRCCQGPPWDCLTIDNLNVVIDHGGDETDDHGNDDPDEGWQEARPPWDSFNFNTCSSHNTSLPDNLSLYLRQKETIRTICFPCLTVKFCQEILLSSVSPLYGPPQGSLSRSLCNEVQFILTKWKDAKFWQFEMNPTSNQ